MSINIRLLKAKYGDSIILSCGSHLETKILIDGGMGKQCQRQLTNFMEETNLNNKKIDLLILTHIDSDHIEGILKLFSNDKFDDSIIDSMWFNFGNRLFKNLNINKKVNTDIIMLVDRDTKISLNQARSLEDIIGDKPFLEKKIIKKLDVYQIGRVRITVLSPSLETLKEFCSEYIVEKERNSKISADLDYNISVDELKNQTFFEDMSLSNRSSIAILVEHDKSNLLFLGDAASSEIEDSLMQLGYSANNPLDVICCKISHHASKHNTSNRLIKMINCSNYIISTCMTASGRPSKECLSRILCNTDGKVTFYCNYDIDIRRIFTDDEINTYKFEFKIMDEKGLSLEELKR